MRVIPRRSIVHYQGELRDVAGLILRGSMREGPYIRKFEEEFAKYIGTKYAAAVASGRLALFLILESLRLDKNAEVILPAYTDESVPAVIKSLGLKPVFIDIDRRNHNIDTELIEGKINDKTGAIIATHIFGRPCNLSKIMEIAERHKLIVIEDCAHAIGAEYNGQRVGTFGKAAYFSFGITKPLNTFGGGMIVTNDPDLYYRIDKEMANFDYPHPFTLIKNMLISYLLFFITRPLFFSIIVFPALLLCPFLNKGLIYAYNKTIKRAISLGKIQTRYTNMQALIGLRQLKNFEAANEKRIRYATLLKDNLSKEIDILQDDPAAKSIYYFFIILAQDIECVSNRLLYRGIDTGRHIMRDCSKIFANDAKCLCAQNALRTSLQIPIHSSLGEQDICYIANVLNQTLGNNPQANTLS